MPTSYGYSFSYQAQMSPTTMAIMAVFVVLYVVCYWKIFVKAGKPGWAAIIPIYNFFVMLQIIGKPWWWFLLLFIPFVNFIVIIMMTHQLAVRFGKGVGYTLGLLFLSIIFIPLLAFGSAKYTPPPAMPAAK